VHQDPVAALHAERATQQVVSREALEHQRRGLQHQRNHIH
jgi:hypothetical protein